MNARSSQKISPFRTLRLLGYLLSLSSLALAVSLPSAANAATSSGGFSFTVSPFLSTSVYGFGVVSPDLSKLWVCGTPSSSPAFAPTFRSTDSGRTFSDVSITTNVGSNSPFTPCTAGVSATSRDGLNIYVDDGGLVQSHDGGITWDYSERNKIGCEALGARLCDGPQFSIRNIATSGNGGNIFVDTNQVDPSHESYFSTSGPLFVSHDFGKSWIERGSPTALPWRDLATTQDGSELIGLTTDSFREACCTNINAFDNETLYFSKDDGISWTTSSALQLLITKIGSQNYANFTPAGQAQGASPTGQIYNLHDRRADHQIEHPFAISAGGQIIYLTVSPVLLVSMDGGITWAERGKTLRPKTSNRVAGYGYLDWYGVSTSDDGKVVDTATSLLGSGSTIYTYFSNDYGKTWVAAINPKDLTVHSGPTCDPSLTYSFPPESHIPRISSNGTEALLFSTYASGPINLTTMAGLCNEILTIKIPAVFSNSPPNPYLAYMNGISGTVVPIQVSKTIVCVKGTKTLSVKGISPSCPTGYRLISKP